VVATLHCDLALPHRLGFIPHLPHNTIIVECEGGKVELYNFLVATIYHSITISKRDGTSRVEKIYKFSDAKVDGKGEEWWTTWRYQLESFVDRLEGRTPQTWLEAKDSVANMEAIEKIFAKVCVIIAIHCDVSHTFTL
jgi:hypothetical protein